MEVVIHVPQYRAVYDRAYAWVTDGLDPNQVGHSQDEIVGLAAEKDLDAVSLIRDWLVAELEPLVGDDQAVVEEDWVARIAVLLALEELEDWVDAIRLEMLDDLVRLLYARYRYEREEVDDDLLA